jgi:hypothetical protein
MTTLRIVVVYPDLLGTYGDGGNGEILAQRARWRGIDVELLQALSTESLPRGDLYCIGGGEDGPQTLAARRLRSDGGLINAVGDGAVVLAVCAGFQVVGRSFPDASGVIHEGVGLLDVVTVKGKGQRAVGEIAVEVPAEASHGIVVPTLSGFENHGGVTSLGSQVAPLGRVVAGVGNGTGDGTEGAVAGKVVGTYLHGPVLARNAAFADVLLGWATRQELEPLDDGISEGLRNERLASLSRASGRGGSGPKP